MFSKKTFQISQLNWAEIGDHKEARRSFCTLVELDVAVGAGRSLEEVGDVFEARQSLFELGGSLNNSQRSIEVHVFFKALKNSVEPSELSNAFRA